MNRVAIGGLALSAAAFVSLIVSEGWTGKAIIPVKGDVPTLGFGTTDMVTFPNGTSGIYLMQGRQTSAPNGGIYAIALVVVGIGTGSLSVTNLATGSMSFTIGAGARTVAVTNNAGGSLGTTVSWIRLMGNT